MAGIISSGMQAPDTTQANAAYAPTTAASTNIADPLLKKTKMGVEAKINPRIKSQFLSIENAGLALMSSGNMPKLIMQKIQSNPDVATVVSDGVANMIAMIYNHVIPTIPKPGAQQFNSLFVAAAPSAAIALMCQVLDMAEQALHTQVGQQLVAQCAKETAQKVLGKLHIGNGQIQQAVAAGKANQGA